MLYRSATFYMIYGKTPIVAEAIYKTKLRHMIFQIGKDRVVVKG